MSGLVERVKHWFVHHFAAKGVYPISSSSGIIVIQIRSCGCQRVLS